MSHHHTSRIAFDIWERMESIQDRTRRPSDEQASIVEDMQRTVDLVRRWSWFQPDRRLIETLTTLTREPEQAETSDDIAEIAARFCATVRAVTDPY